MNKQEIEKAIAYWKKFKSEISGLKVTCQFPDLDLDEQEKFTDLAISALEKQIPKKPIEVIDEKRWEDWACPECRTLIEGGSVMLHCWNCGQKLDWSVEE